MSEEVAKLKATVELDTNKTEVKVKQLDEQFNKLEKTIRKVDASLTKQELNQQKLTQALEKSKQATVNSSIAEEKLIQAKEKSKQAATKSIADEQKLATEREKTRKATIQTEQAELRLNKQKDSLNKTTNESNGLWSTLSTRFTVAGLAVNAITGLFNKLTSSIKDSYNEAVKFQENMSLVNTITDLSKGKINDLSSEVANMGKSLGKAPSEMAMGMYDVASSTDDTVDRLHVLEKATKASKAGFTDVSTAVDAGIGMMNAFGLGVSDLDRIYDLQFKTVDRGIIKYGELKESLGNMMSSAVNAKVPMEEMLGQLAFLTKSGQNYAKSSVALARTYDTVFEKGDKLKKFLNVDVSDGNNNLRSTTDIMADMAKELSKFDEISQVNLLEEIGFSDRSSRAIIALMGNVDGVRKEINLVSDSAGSMEQAFIKASDNIATEGVKAVAKISTEMSKLVLENEKLIIALMKGFSGFFAWVIRGYSAIGRSVGNFIDDIKERKIQNNLVREFEKFKKVNSKWLDDNKAFVTESEKLRQEDIKNSEGATDILRADYENRLRILNEYNSKMLTATAKASNEKYRLETLGSPTASKTKLDELAYATSSIKKSDYGAVIEMLNTGKFDSSKLSKATSVQRVSQSEYENMISGFINKYTSGYGAGGIAKYSVQDLSSYLLANMGGGNSVAKDVSVETGLKHYETPEKEKKKAEKFDYSKALSEFKLEMDTQGIKEGTEKYLEEYKNFLESSTKSLIDLGSEGTKDLSIVKTEYAKVTSQLDELGKYNYTKEYSNFLTLMKGKGIQEGTEKFNDEEKKFLENSVEKMIEQGQNVDEITKKLEQINLNEETEKHLKAYNDIFKEEEEFADKIKKTGQDINTEENIAKVVEIWEKQIDDLIALSEGSDQFNTQIADIQANINKYKKKDKSSYNTTEMEDEFTIAFRGKNSVESMNSTYDTLFEKYKGNTEALELLTDIYNNQTGNIETFSDKLSASAGFVSELSSVLDNEFLSSLANAMNGISSMSSVIGSAGGIANLGFGGWTSIATSALSIVGPIIESWSGDGGISEKQEAAAQVFEDAVETFKAAIEDYSTAEKINYANLTAPSSLSEVTTGGGGVDTLLSTSPILGGIMESLGLGTGASNATVDLSGLKEQLTTAGYTELASQLDSILGNYAQYSSYTDWSDWGKKKSYISGYDTTGFLTEVNALIEEAYQTNLDAYKEQVGLTSDSFVSAISSALESGENLDLTDMITSAFNESYSAMIGEVFGENIGDVISETMFDVLENAGVTQSDLANMSVADQIAYIQSLMDNSSTYLSEVFEKLGISASKVTEEFDSLSNQDLPSLVKIGAYEALASNNYTSSTIVNIGMLNGSLDRTFENLTKTAVNSTNNKRTMN